MLWLGFYRAMYFLVYTSFSIGIHPILREGAYAWSWLAPSDPWSSEMLIFLLLINDLFIT